MAPNVFVSYRRQDTEHLTGRLCDRLVQAYGDDRVFRDVVSTEGGADFRARIREKIAQADVVVVVIGKEWLRLLRERAARPGVDYVTFEIGEALERGTPVIPVLCSGAVVPEADELPEPIRALAKLQAVELPGDPGFHEGVDRLLLAIGRHKPTWRWFSTHESAEDLQFSVLALLETALATAAFGFVVARHGTLYLTISSLAAPLLLLRTAESTRLGIRHSGRMGDAIWESLDRTRKLLDHCPSALALPLAIVALPLGIAVTFAAFCIGKVTSTAWTLVRHPWTTIAAIPTNWTRHVASLDSATPPEFVPGSSLAVRDWNLALGVDRQLLRFMSPVEAFLDEVRRSESYVEKGISSVLILPVLAVAVVVAVLYRWSLKGSALLFVPLVWILGSSIAVASPLDRVDYVRNSVPSWLALAVSTAVLVTGAFKLVFNRAFTQLVDSVTLGGEFVKVWAAPAEVPVWQAASFTNALLGWALFLIADGAWRTWRRHGRHPPSWVGAVMRAGAVLRPILSVYAIACSVYIAASLVEHWSLPPLGTRLVPWQD